VPGVSDFRPLYMLHGVDFNAKKFVHILVTSISPCWNTFLSIHYHIKMLISGVHPPMSTYLDRFISYHSEEPRKTRQPTPRWVKNRAKPG
jgi:hypothetical protein